MSRDMKPRKATPAKKKAAGGTLIGMFIGLVIGVAAAAGVVLYLNKSPLPFNKQVQAGNAVQNNNPPVNGNAHPAAPVQPLALPGKPGDPIPEKRFQFYDILPGKADAVPDGKPGDSKKPDTKDVKKDDQKKDENKKEDAKKEELKQPIFLQACLLYTSRCV